MYIVDLFRMTDGRFELIIWLTNYCVGVVVEHFWLVANWFEDGSLATETPSTMWHAGLQLIMSSALYSGLVS